MDIDKEIELAKLRIRELELIKEIKETEEKGTTIIFPSITLPPITIPSPEPTFPYKPGEPIWIYDPNAPGYPRWDRSTSGTTTITTNPDNIQIYNNR